MEDKKLKPDFDIKRDPKTNLRSYYYIFFEIGLIIALLIFIILARMDLTFDAEEHYVIQEREEVEMQEIVQTQQDLTPPPPPRPPVPVSVPNDEILEDVDIDIGGDLDIGAQLSMPPPPPSQNNEVEEEEDFFVLVEDMPVLKGGLESLQNKVRYPERALRANIQGRVIVQFIVNERGEVENPVVTRGIGGGCDEEAIRVVKQAEFIPGMQRGRPVRVQYSLPVIFVLRN